MKTENQTSEFLLKEYEKGRRVFVLFDFSSDVNNPACFKDVNLSGCLFYKCSFHSSQLNQVSLNGVEFIMCNLKCLELSNCDLSNSKIIDCVVEANLWNNVKTDNIVFLINGSYGTELNQENFKDTKESFEKGWFEYKK